MRFTWKDKAWNFDQEMVTAQQLKTVKKETGLNWPGEVFEGASKFDPDAVITLMWLVQQQNGDDTPFSDTDGAIVSFFMSFGEGMEKEAATTDPQPAGTVAGSNPGTSEISTTDISVPSL